MFLNFLLVLFITNAARADADENLSVVYPNKKQTFSLKELKAKLPVFEVTTNDPVYKSTKTFKGFLLKDILNLIGPLPTVVDEISFVAKDGYSPSISVSEGLSSISYVTFAEKNRKNNWQLIKQGKKMLNPGPFYLVWKDEEKVPEYFPRPYQLIRIELIEFKTLYRSIYPEGLAQKENEKKGFVIFKNNCVKCHSLNGAGGTLGPELNYPKNVTEYWNLSEMRTYLKNPSAFRLRAVMPSFDKLDEPSVDYLIKYLTFMKDHKEPPQP